MKSLRWFVRQTFVAQTPHMPDHGNQPVARSHCLRIERITHTSQTGALPRALFFGRIICRAGRNMRQNFAVAAPSSKGIQSKMWCKMWVESVWIVVMYNKIKTLRRCCGGERGIRTLETVPRLHTFQACAFDHSATSPSAGCLAVGGAGGKGASMTFARRQYGGAHHPAADACLGGAFG